jgi:hypothetical protein
MTSRNIDDIINNIYAIIGDTPVAVQLDMAIKSHKHENYVSREEYEVLQAQVNKLLGLVGDTPVSEQIAKALK